MMIGRHSSAKCRSGFFGKKRYTPIFRATQELERKMRL